MSIIIKNLRRPGLLYDSTKMATLGGMIAASIRERTNGNYYASSKVQQNRLIINIKGLNKHGEYVKVSKDEQIRLAARISSFLQQNNIVGDVEVK